MPVPRDREKPPQLNAQIQGVVERHGAVFRPVDEKDWGKQRGWVLRALRVCLANPREAAKPRAPVLPLPQDMAGRMLARVAAENRAEDGSVKACRAQSAERRAQSAEAEAEAESSS
eukprot:scaffold1981_cov345-Pinguiococcus_pyrenoidosus.AAC.3